MMIKSGDKLRLALKGADGKVKQAQVDGVNEILHACARHGVDDIRYIAYMLATAYHETGHTMQPVLEHGGASYFTKLYWLNKKVAGWLGNQSAADAVKYCGRGYAQITGFNNYLRFSKILGIDLINEPHRACEPINAADILVIGMMQGVYTGKKLAHYFNDNKSDPLNARRIINGMDKADAIRVHYNKFLAAL
jgi:putative chitinase